MTAINNSSCPLINIISPIFNRQFFRFNCSNRASRPTILLLSCRDLFRALACSEIKYPLKNSFAATHTNDQKGFKFPTSSSHVFPCYRRKELIEKRMDAIERNGHYFHTNLGGLRDIGGLAVRLLPFTREAVGSCPEVVHKILRFDHCFKADPSLNP